MPRAAALAVHAVRIDHVGQRVEREAHHALDRARSRLDRDQGRLTADAGRHLRGAEAAVADAAVRVRVRPQRAVIAAERRVDALAAQARALDPARVLARGWSITRRNDGAVVRSVHDVGAGDEIVTLVADGSLHSTITHHEPRSDED